MKIRSVSFNNKRKDFEVSNIRKDVRLSLRKKQA